MITRNISLILALLLMSCHDKSKDEPNSEIEIAEYFQKSIDENEKAFAKERAITFMNEIRKYKKIFQLRQLVDGRGVLNGFTITDNQEEFEETKKDTFLSPIYMYQSILDTFKIDQKDFIYFSKKLQSVKVDLYVDNGNYSLFMIDSFNGDFSGYMYSHLDTKVSGQIQIEFKDFYTKYNEKLDDHWYRVDGGW